MTFIGLLGQIALWLFIAATVLLGIYVGSMAAYFGWERAKEIAHRIEVDNFMKSRQYGAHQR